MKNYLTWVIILFYFVFQSCNSTGEYVAPPDKDTLTTKVSKTDSEQIADTLLKSQDTLVVKNFNGQIDTLLKFHSKLSQKKYYVGENFKGKPTKLNFSHFEYGKLYITRTKDAVMEGVNFAGHYTIAAWGCGSPCWMSAIVDLKSGNVYDGPTGCYGYYSVVTSKAFQVNPPDYEGGWYHAARTCGAPKEYIWNGRKFIPIK